MSRYFYRSFNLALILTIALSSMAMAPMSLLPLPLPAPIPDLATPMSTLITTDTVWNSNQLVNQDVVIQNGATLTITSGVSVTVACSDTMPYSGGYDNSRSEIIVENGQLHAEGVSFGPQNPTPGCWYGIEFRSGTGGYIRQSALTGGLVGIMAENSLPQVVSNTIRLMTGPNGAGGSSPGGAGNPGLDTAGIWITGTLASPLVVGNQIAQIQGGRGGAGAAGANATAASQPGGSGGDGGVGGGAYGILVMNGATPTISGNTVISLTGGTGGQGGNGGNGYSFASGGGTGRSGGNGGGGGAGGRGGIAVGILINYAAPTVSENIIGMQGNGLSGGAGQNGGAGGTGGTGDGGGIDAFGGAGPGGSGGNGGTSGSGGSGGDAHGIYIQNAATPIILHNDITNVKGGAGGAGSNGGAPGLGGVGCAGTTGGFWPGLGGNGGYAGTGGKGGDARGGGQAVGITVIDSTPQKLARNAIHSISGGNAGAAGNGGAITTPGGTGGAGSDVNPPGAGGAGGSGTNGGNGGNGGAGGNGIGLLVSTVVSDALTLPVVNNVIWDCRGGNASANAGNGGNASQGGSGGRGGTYFSWPTLLVGPGGNGGQGGYGGNGGTGGDAGNGVGLWITGVAAPTLTNNTVAYGAFGTSGSGGTSGNGGQGGPGGSGNPVGPQGPPGIVGQNGQVGALGYTIGAIANGQANPSLFNNIFRSPIGSITNTVGIFASSPATTTHDYNDVFGYQLSFSPDGPSAHDILADPSFVSTTDLHLQKVSPSVDTASDGMPARPSDDRDGNPRPLDGDRNGTAQTDRGAYERGFVVVTKQVDKVVASQGQVLTYTLVVSGSLLPPSLTMPITITDSAPMNTVYNDHLTYTLGTSSESPTGFNWHGSLANTGLITLTFQVTATTLVGTITNTASYQDADGVWQTNQVETARCVPITDVVLSQIAPAPIHPNTVITFSADLAPDNAHGPYDYSIHFNDGTSPLAGVSSSDPFTFTHSFAVTGTFAVVFDAWNCDMTLPVTDSAAVTVTQRPRLIPVVTKSVNTDLAHFGDALTYTLVVSGGLLPPMEVAPVTVTDSAPFGAVYNDHLTYTSGSANPGQTGFTWNGDLAADELVTITFQVTVTAFSGTITNTAVYQDADGIWETNQVATTIPYMIFLPVVLKNGVGSFGLSGGMVK